MIDVCFCGWAGELKERRPARSDDERLVLACPKCGHQDTLNYLSARERRETLRGSLELHLSRWVADADVRQPVDATIATRDVA